MFHCFHGALAMFPRHQSSLQEFLAQFVLQLGGRAKEFDPNLQSLVILIKTPVFKGSKSIFWGRATYTPHQSNCI
jgi:hypothetical protein